MNNDMFLEEANRFIEEKYQDFLKYHHILEDIFEEFHNICIDNNLDYFIGFGSLLARVRDGQKVIPWDPDFDVVIPYNQAKKLAKALKENLSDKYFFRFAVDDAQFNEYMIRIGLKGYNLDYLHFDIFFLIGAPKKQIDKFRKKIKFYFKAREAKERTQFFGSKKIILLKKIINFLKYCYIPRCFINNKLKNICNKHNIEDSAQLIILGPSALVFNKEVFYPKKLITDKLGSYCSPNNPEDFLNLVYNDYKSYMPIKDRFEEFYRWISIMEIINK